MRIVHARASVSTLLPYGLGLVVRCPAERFEQKAMLTYFQLLARRRDVDPAQRFFFVSGGNIIDHLFWWQSFFFPRHGFG